MPTKKKNQYQLTLYTAKGTKIKITGHCDEWFRMKIMKLTKTMDVRIMVAGGLAAWLKKTNPLRAC